VQAILAAAVIWTWGWYWADPITSLLIAGLVVYSSWELVRSSVDVLMEGVPDHIGLDAVTTTLAGIPGVRDVHDLHVWSIASGFVALSAHLVIDTESDSDRILRVAENRLKTEFQIEHSTIQMDIGAPCSAHLH
jgi:cobalt-zinc-cadmium efflux system protein